MKIAYYIHGLKWKDEEISPSDVKGGFVSFHIYDNPRYEEKRHEDGNDLEYVEVRAINFEIEDSYDHIAFNDASYHMVLEMVQFSREGNSSHRMEYQGNEILNINVHGQFFTLGTKRAVCNDPHVFVNSKGELAYREIEVKVEPIRLMRVKKTVFDIIDLE